MYLYIWRGVQAITEYGKPHPSIVPSNAVLIVAGDCLEARTLWEGSPHIVDGEPDHVYRLQDGWPTRKQVMEFGAIVSASYDTNKGVYVKKEEEDDC